MTPIFCLGQCPIPMAESFSQEENVMAEILDNKCSGFYSTQAKRLEFMQVCFCFPQVLAFWRVLGKTDQSYY